MPLPGLLNEKTLPGFSSQKIFFRMCGKLSQDLLTTNVSSRSSVGRRYRPGPHKIEHLSQILFIKKSL